MSSTAPVVLEIRAGARMTTYMTTVSMTVAVLATPSIQALPQQIEGIQPAYPKAARSESLERFSTTLKSSLREAR